MDADLKKLIPILLQNNDKNFVKRILNREEYPVLNNPDGSQSSHSMAWSSGDNANYVYPTVVYDEPNKKMVRLNGKDAFDHAVKNNEYIKFDTPDDADWFSQRYKDYWKY